MDNYGIYRDIARRTDGDIYIGVVGPVRTGKSTFIKKAMKALVLPNMTDQNKKDRAIDEMPQSAAGKTIMTTEPKFVPNEAVEVSLGDNAKFKVRMIDCVGYIVEGALGHIEEDQPRMVMTPWFEKAVPFNMAAEVGTKKVIEEHSTIGLVITTDGSIADIPREEYIDAEQRVIGELKKINKPFVILLNCAHPEAPQAKALRESLEAQHGVPCILANCLELTEADIKRIIEKILFEFPVKEIGFFIPGWLSALDNEHWLKASVYASVFDAAKDIKKISQIKGLLPILEENDHILSASVADINLGIGKASINVEFDDQLFYQILSEQTGLEIEDEGQLVSMMSEMARMREEYMKVEKALKQANATGYGIVEPSAADMHLEEPEIVRQSGRCGLKLRASASSIHMIRADIQSEISPIMGSEKQTEQLVQYLLKEYEEHPESIWEADMFGKSLYELMSEGLNNKLARMPEEVREKFRQTLQRIINEGGGALICIIL